MVLNFRGSFDPRIFFLTVDGYKIWTSAWCVESTTRYRESQVLLAVTLWLSRVVVDWTFTSVGIRVFYFNSEIFPIYGSTKPQLTTAYNVYGES